MTNIIVPALGESVSEAIIARWMKAVGENVIQDEPIVELETDKVTLEVNAPSSGILSEIKSPGGATVSTGDVIGVIGESGTTTQSIPNSKGESIPLALTPLTSGPLFNHQESTKMSPAASKIMNENNISPQAIQGTGKDSMITKGDVLKVGASKEPQQSAPASPSMASSQPQPKPLQEIKPRDDLQGNRTEERVRMSRLRARIAERLMHSQKSTATLTTFNEIDMTAVMDVRNNFKDVFDKKYGIRLGFMSFFVKAAVVALKEIPAVNAEIEGEDVIYKNYYDIGVAVGTPQGLVVPIVRDVDVKSFAQVELDIAHLAQKARDGKLSVQDMTGGTFTVSNGGVYGSLLSTPILNPPQSGILGMHKVEKRAVVINDKIEIRPMMYVALSYDHRIIDGTESVTFLKRIKECVENPERILLEI